MAQRDHAELLRKEVGRQRKALEDVEVSQVAEA
jgi:hypothetical protein